MYSYIQTVYDTDKCKSLQKMNGNNLVVSIYWLEFDM